MPSQHSVNTAISFSFSSLIKVKRDKSIILAAAKGGKNYPTCQKIRVINNTAAETKHLRYKILKKAINSGEREEEKPETNAF